MLAARALANENRPAVERPHLQLVPAEPGLTAVERQAAEIGRDDAFRYDWDASIARASWRRRLVGFLVRLTGLPAVTPLADARLERMRLFASMMRRDDRRLHAVADALLTDGLSRTALRQAIDVALG